MSVPASELHLRPEGGKIKVWFRFVPREGWLPHDTEGLWAKRVGANTAQIMNVPFLQDGVAQDDVVRFVSDNDGVLWSVERVEPSGSCTIRVLPIPTGPLGRSATAVHEKFAPYGLGGEVFSNSFPLVAFNVPAGADLQAIKELLVTGEAEGWWHFEVGCATEQWLAA